MTDVFGSGDHEQVVFCRDEPSGLRAIVAIHSTALGPALGGTRFHPYPSEDDALQDVLHLATAMSYKNALAGLNHGGGKAVILGDPTRDKTEALLHAYGRFVQSLSGRYITACDVGTYVEDMDVVARESEFVTGRSLSHGGAGDSSILTAFGVFQGMRAAAQHVWGAPTLSGRRVGISGVGKVGKLLVDHLLADGAQVVVADISDQAIERVTAAHPEVAVVADTAALVREPIDVYAPCALGSALDDPTVAVLRAKIVCGGANNQLGHPGVEKFLDEPTRLPDQSAGATPYQVRHVAGSAIWSRYEAVRAFETVMPSAESTENKEALLGQASTELPRLATHRPEGTRVLSPQH